MRARARGRGRHVEAQVGHVAEVDLLVVDGPARRRRRKHSPDGRSRAANTEKNAAATRAGMSLRMARASDVPKVRDSDGEEIFCKLISKLLNLVHRKNK